MSTPRDIRRLAFLALYQLDARSEPDDDEVRATLRQSAEELSTAFRESDIDKAMRKATEAFAKRRAHDALIRELAPSWPAHRQPAVDRAILRLALHEMETGGAPPKVAIAEAVRLAKAYSTDRSPAFVNGVLDRVYKSMPARATEAGVEDGDGA